MSVATLETIQLVFLTVTKQEQLRTNYDQSYNLEFGLLKVLDFTFLEHGPAEQNVS